MATHPAISRALLILGVTYALAWFTVALVVGPGSAAFVELSGRLDFAGYFIAVYFVGVAAGGAVIGRAMDRWGRRPLLAAAHSTAAIGFALCAVAVHRQTLWLFAGGDLVLAFGMGGIFLTRLAAAEMFPPAARGRAVARMQLSALGGAIAGPLLLVASEPLGRAIGTDAAQLIWFVAPPVLLVSSLLVLLAPETRHIARNLSAYHPDTELTPGARPVALQLRPLLTGIASLALAQAAMVMAMGVTGAALRHEGHGVSAVGYALAGHFLGMFALSTLVGRVSDRFGRRPTIIAGFMLIAVGGLLMAFSRGVAAFSVAIFLVGLGWSGAYIGGTVLVTDATPADRGGRVLGLADMTAAVLTIGASLGGGAWYAARGLPGLGLLAVAMVVAPILLVWTLRELRPGVYARVPAADGPTPAP